MEIAYCCFEVSSQCNMGCEFCFSNWRKAKKQMPTKKAFGVIDELKANGLKAINLTGGEVLLREDIVDICKYAKEKGLYTIISTNGIRLLEKLEVLDYIDAINLPLDSYNPKIHNQMRPCVLSNHHLLVLDLIEHVSKNFPHIKIKINTLVSGLNSDEIIKIGELLNGKVQRWKLGKFFPSGYGKNFEKKYEISDEEYNLITSEVSYKYQECGFFTEDFKNDFIFIDNQGQINLSTLSGIINLGDITNLSKLKNINSRTSYYNNIYEEK